LRNTLCYEDTFNNDAHLYFTVKHVKISNKVINNMTNITITVIKHAFMITSTHVLVYNDCINKYNIFI